MDFKNFIKDNKNKPLTNSGFKPKCSLNYFKNSSKTLLNMNVERGFKNARNKNNKRIW